MRRLTLIIVSASLSSAFSASVPFNQSIDSAKQQVLSTDYAEASLTIQQARTSLATLAEIKRDYSAIKAAGMTDSSKATTEMVLNALADAVAKHSQNDVPGTLRSLDLAFLATSTLSALQPPAQRYSFAKAALQKAMAANQTGDGLDPSFHRAAATAYAAGQFDESLAYINQASVLTRSRLVVSPYLHLFHTIAGLDYLAKGQIDLAVSELNLSAQQFPSAKFYPSMALANALSIKNPTAVMKYLDAAVAIQAWPGRAEVAVWKGQLQAGQQPVFGTLVNRGL